MVMWKRSKKKVHSTSQQNTIFPTVNRFYVIEASLEASLFPAYYLLIFLLLLLGLVRLMQSKLREHVKMSFCRAKYSYLKHYDSVLCSIRVIHLCNSLLFLNILCSPLLPLSTPLPFFHMHTLIFSSFRLPSLLLQGAVYRGNRVQGW